MSILVNTINQLVHLDVFYRVMLLFCMDYTNVYHDIHCSFQNNVNIHSKRIEYLLVKINLGSTSLVNFFKLFVLWVLTKKRMGTWLVKITNYNLRGVRMNKLLKKINGTVELWWTIISAISGLFACKELTNRLDFQGLDFS